METTAGVEALASVAWSRAGMASRGLLLVVKTRNQEDKLGEESENQRKLGLAGHIWACWLCV